MYNPNKIQEDEDRAKSDSDLKSVLRRLKIFKNSLDPSVDGTIEIKYYRKPLYYQMWIKDAFGDGGMAHFSVSHFDGFKPHFRMTPQTSYRLFNYMKNEFLAYWNDDENVSIND